MLRLYGPISFVQKEPPSIVVDPELHKDFRLRVYFTSRLLFFTTPCEILSCTVLCRLWGLHCSALCLTFVHTNDTSYRLLLTFVIFYCNVLPFSMVFKSFTISHPGYVVTYPDRLVCVDLIIGLSNSVFFNTCCFVATTPSPIICVTYVIYTDFIQIDLSVLLSTPSYPISVIRTQSPTFSVSWLKFLVKWLISSGSFGFAL